MIFDLSVALEDNPGEPIRPVVEHQDHAATADLVAGIFGCRVEDLPGGQGWGNDTVTAITHAGTHVDAPWHYFPTCAGEAGPHDRTSCRSTSRWYGRAPRTPGARPTTSTPARGSGGRGRSGCSTAASR